MTLGDFNFKAIEQANTFLGPGNESDAVVRRIEMKTQ